MSQCAKYHIAGWTWAVFTCICLESCTWPVAIFTIDQRKEQRVCIKFCANLGKSATETLTMIQQAFGDQILSRTQVFQWHARIKTGRKSVDDDQQTGRPRSSTTPETVAWIQELFRQDRRRTIHDIAEEVGIRYGTWQRALTENLRMHDVAAKFVPRILTADQKQHRVNVCAELRQLASDDESFLSRFITGDESWVYGYDPETKQQSSQWKSPTSSRPKKARQVKCNFNSMIITFFDVKGIVHKEFVSTGQNLNSGFYCDVLRRLRENVRRRRPKLWQEQIWLLHHENFRPHTAVSGEKQNDCHPPPTVLPWFGTLWLLPISKNEIESERMPVWYHWGDTGRIAESAWHSDRKGLPGSVPKMEETVGLVSICTRELLRGWRRPICLMMSFTIFTASVQKILDTTSYEYFGPTPHQNRLHPLGKDHRKLFAGNEDVPRISLGVCSSSEMRASAWWQATCTFWPCKDPATYIH